MVKMKRIIATLLLFVFAGTVMLSKNLEVLAVKWDVTQKKYTLVAKNVRNVRVSFTGVFLSQKKNKVVQVDLVEKLKRKDVRSNIYYRNRLISKNAKDYFPPDQNRLFIRNSRNEILFTGGEGESAFIIYTKQKRSARKMQPQLSRRSSQKI